MRGNVGAFSGEIKDVFVKAHCIRLQENGDYEEMTLSREEMEFAYRSSKVKTEKLIVISAQFQLREGTPEELLQAHETYFSNVTYRQDKHPLDYPNCVSVYRDWETKEKG